MTCRDSWELYRLLTVNASSICVRYEYIISGTTWHLAQSLIANYVLRSTVGMYGISQDPKTVGDPI